MSPIQVCRLGLRNLELESIRHFFDGIPEALDAVRQLGPIRYSKKVLDEILPARCSMHRYAAS